MSEPWKTPVCFGFYRKIRLQEPKMALKEDILDQLPTPWNFGKGNDGIVIQWLHIPAELGHPCVPRQNMLGGWQGQQRQKRFAIQLLVDRPSRQW